MFVFTTLHFVLIPLILFLIMIELNYNMCIKVVLECTMALGLKVKCYCFARNSKPHDCTTSQCLLTCFWMRATASTAPFVLHFMSNKTLKENIKIYVLNLHIYH